MPEIITMTFSSCIDKSARVERLVPEKKMRCADPKSEPGVGGINVARVLNILGGNVMAVFPSEVFTGTHLNKLLQIEKIPPDAILSKNESKENFAIFDQAPNKQYRYGMPANELFEEEWIECLKIIENHKIVDYILARGSLPIGVPLKVYKQLSKIAQKFYAILKVDTSGNALKRLLRNTFTC
jgi:6-phosphofructokinase 2